MAAVLPNQTTAVPMSGLARALVQAGRLSAQQAEALNKQALSEKAQFIDVLVNSGAIDARSLAAFCAETFGYPQLDLSALSRSHLPDNVVDPKLMQKRRVIALAKRGNKVSIAISDPTDTQTLDPGAGSFTYVDWLPTAVRSYS